MNFPDRWIYCLETVPVPDGISARIAFRVNGDRLAPAVHHGDIICCDEPGSTPQDLAVQYCDGLAFITGSKWLVGIYGHRLWLVKFVVKG